MNLPRILRTTAFTLAAALSTFPALALDAGAVEATLAVGKSELIQLPTTAQEVLVACCERANLPLLGELPWGLAYGRLHADHRAEQ